MTTKMVLGKVDYNNVGCSEEIRKRREMKMYYTADGEEITQAQIEQAVKNGKAVIRWSHGNWANIASLSIHDTPEEAEDEAKRDTRGQCWSMSDEVWSEPCLDFKRARKAAAGLLRIS